MGEGCASLSTWSCRGSSTGRDRGAAISGRAGSGTSPCCGDYRNELEFPADRLPAIPSYELSGAAAADVAEISAGAELYGLPGALIALPLLAVARAIWEFFSDRIQFEEWKGRAVPVEVEVEETRPIKPVPPEEPPEAKVAP